MTKQQATLNGMREMLWAGLVWNDHNFCEGTLAMKCRQLCKDAGIKNVDQANRFLDRMQERLTSDEVAIDAESHLIALVEKLLWHADECGSISADQIRNYANAAMTAYRADREAEYFDNSVGR